METWNGRTEVIDLILVRLREMWIENSDLRLGQILLNASALGGRATLFYTEDGSLYEGLGRFQDARRKI